MAFEIARRHRFFGDMAALPDHINGPRDAHRPGRGAAVHRPVAVQVPRHSAASPANRPRLRGVEGVPERAALMPVPPKIVRRLILAPLLVVLELVLLVLSPVFAARRARSPRRSPAGCRPLRLLAILEACVAYHLGATLAVFGLWVASGFGWKLRSETMVRAHYAVMRWFVAGIYRVATRMAKVRRGLRGVRRHPRDPRRQEQARRRAQPPRRRGRDALRPPRAADPPRPRPARGPARALQARLDDRRARRAPAQPLRGPARRRHRGRDRRHGRGARGHRRAGDLPRGRELLRAHAAAGHRAPGGERLAQAGRGGEGDDLRERTPPRRHAGGDRGGAPLRTW